MKTIKVKANKIINASKKEEIELTFRVFPNINSLSIEVNSQIVPSNLIEIDLNQVLGSALIEQLEK